MAKARKTAVKARRAKKPARVATPAASGAQPAPVAAAPDDELRRSRFNDSLHNDWSDRRPNPGQPKRGGDQDDARAKALRGILDFSAPAQNAPATTTAGATPAAGTTPAPAPAQPAPAASNRRHLYEIAAAVVLAIAGTAFVVMRSPAPPTPVATAPAQPAPAATAPAPAAQAPAPAPAAPAQPAPAPAAQAPAQGHTPQARGACDDGFKEYSEGVRCRKMYAEVKPPEKAEPCKPGAKREIPDPKRPGFTLFQECGTMPKKA